MSENKIQERLRKLINLRDNAQEVGSEGEAQVAALKITQLLLEYNLSESDVPDLEKINNPIEITKIEYKTSLCSGKWYEALVATVCKYNMCKVIISLGVKNGRNYKSNFNIIGRRSNIEITLYLIDYLSRIFYNIGAKSYRLDNLGLTRAKYLKSFLSGCVSGLASKYRDLDITDDIQALVITNDSEVTKFMKDSFSNVKKGRASKEQSNIGATIRGFDTGKNVEINKGITVTKNKQLNG